MQELAGTVRSLANGKAVEPDGFSVKLFKITLNGDPALSQRLLDIVVCIWRRGKVPQQWKGVIFMIFYKKEDRTECCNYRGISLIVHAAKILLKIISRRLSENCERVKILPEKRSGLRPNRSTTVMMFDIRRLKELARKKQIPMYVCLIDLTKVYDSVNRTLLWTLLARCGVPQIMISVIRQFHDGIRACVRLDDRLCSGRFALEQGLRQGYVLARLLFSIFSAAAIKRGVHASYGGQRHHERFVAFEKEKGGGGGGGKQLPESQSWRRRFETCFTLTMPGLLSNPPSSRGR